MTGKKRYKTFKVSFYVTTKRGKKKKVTFTARKPIMDDVIPTTKAVKRRIK